MKASSEISEEAFKSTLDELLGSFDRQFDES